MRIRLLTAMLAAAVLTAGCGSSGSSDGGSGSGGPAEDTSDTGHRFDGDWTLRDGLVDGGPSLPVDGHPITVAFDGDTISGTAGCNGFSGSFSAADGRLRIGDLAITEMACADPAAMAAESAFVQGLLQATAIELVEDELVISGEEVSLRFAPVAPIPDAAVVGTTWTLDTLIDGQAASSTVAGAERATLLLEEGRRFTASTGCRDLAGDYTLDGDRLTLRFELGPASETEPEACDGAAASQDETVVAVLRQELTVEVVENRLTVTAADGTGLSYRTE